MIYIVTTGWLGNGYEAVIVDSSNEESAKHIARQRLLGSLTKSDDKFNPLRRETIEAMEGWEVEEIELPYVCEIG